jgi:hypothetical protein
LRDALAASPDKILQTFPEAKGKIIVHCILHNEPFSLPEGIDGIYLYDWSALSQFFGVGLLSVNHDHRGPNNTVFRNRVTIKRLWSGDKPEAVDLLEELKNPSQYRIVEHHVQAVRAGVLLDSATLAIDVNLVRTPTTTISFAASLGVSGDGIEEQLAKVDELITSGLARAASVEKVTGDDKQST